jgi:hypothetical protein
VADAREPPDVQPPQLSSTLPTPLGRHSRREPLLEDGLDVMLVNARAVKNMPGRKSDVSDAAWLADLGAHGLVRASLVPPPPIRQLRDLTRARTVITRERSREAQRLEKLLEDAGIKLTSVVSNITGVSSRTPESGRDGTGRGDAAPDDPRPGNPRDRNRGARRQRAGCWGFFGLSGQMSATGLGLTGPCRSRRWGAKVLIQTVASVRVWYGTEGDTPPGLIGGTHRSAGTPS